MAPSNNIIRFADFPRRRDAVLAALESMQAASNDSQYEAARLAFIAARPSSLAGVQAKHDAAMAMLESVREGDELTPAGWDELFALLQAVHQTLGNFAARVA